MPLHGESLFSLVGPVMNDDEAVKRHLQDSWEEVFLPARVQACASSACDLPA